MDGAWAIRGAGARRGASKREREVEMKIGGGGEAEM
jgi:hypothetical protein